MTKVGILLSKTLTKSKMDITLVIVAVENVWPNTKINLCLTHLYANLQINLEKICGDAYKTESSLKEIQYLWLGCAYLPIQDNNLHEMIKKRILDIMRRCPMENRDAKVNKMEIYLAKYFSMSGLFKLDRWNFHSAVIGDFPFIGSTNGAEV